MDVYKLDNYDRIILAELDRNARIPNSAIAKKARLSKQAVGYRINKLEESGVIRGYRGLANISRMGRIYSRLHIKLFNLDRAKEREIVQSIAAMDSTGWTVNCDGPYDILVGVLGRNEMEIEETINHILLQNRDYVFEYDFAFVTRLVNFQRGYLSKTHKVEKRHFTVGEKELYKKPDPIALDDQDKVIISLLAEDARVPALKIAKESGLSPETVSARIKRFENEGIIARYSLLLNHSRLGMNLYKTLVYANPMEKKVEEEFIESMAVAPNIISYAKALAPWNYEIDIEAEDQDHYREIVGSLRDRFKFSIRKYETLFNLKEYKFGYMKT